MLELFVSFLFASTDQSSVANPNTFEWPNGAKSAIALTYDDSLNSHLDVAVPALDQHGLKGTFYITLEAQAFLDRLPEWKIAAANGHELGNHTIYHPCSKSVSDRDWVMPDADLDTYSVDGMVRELQLTSRFLTSIDGKTSRSFAYPCGEEQAGGESYVDAIAPLFSGSRGILNQQVGISYPHSYDRMNMGTLFVDDPTIDELKEYVDEIIEKDGFGSITFHGVGAEHLIVSVEVHQQLLDYLNEHQSEIWVATVHEIFVHLQSEAE